MPEKKPMEREYGEMIYSMLSEMNGAFMGTLRQVNNNIANVQRLMLDLNGSINNLIASLKETRDKRYQEEIDTLEAQMDNLRKQLEEKRAAKNTTVTTSEKIESVVVDVIKKRNQEEQQRNAIDWIDVRNKVLIVVITAIVLYSLPYVGQFFAYVFAHK